MNVLAFLVAIILFILAAFGIGEHLVDWGLAALAAGHLLGGDVSIPFVRRKPPQ